MNASRFSATLLAVLLAGAAAPAGAESETGVALRENALTVGWPNRPAGLPLPDGTLGMTETRLRAWAGQTWGDLAVSGAVEVSNGFRSTGAGNLGLLGGGGSTDTLRAFEWGNLTWDQATPSAATARARVERADVAWHWGGLDLDLGRQPVSLGTSHFVGVLDVVAPFAPGALDGSYKPGVDALRIRAPLGDTGEAELLAAGKEPWSTGATLARMRSAVGGFDLEAVGGRFRDRGMAGLGWEGELGPAGLWGELALFQHRPGAEVVRAGWSEAALAGVVGADFSLPMDVHLGLAGLYSDFGARRPQDLASVYADAPFREGWAFLGSAGYGVITLSKQLHPLVTGSLAGLVNAVDGSSLWQPRLTFSISDNADLGAYGWLGLGGAPHLEGTTLVPTSEFGMVPTGLGLYARWFF